MEGAALSAQAPELSDYMQASVIPVAALTA
jgi:hypothetical protein